MTEEPDTEDYNSYFNRMWNQSNREAYERMWGGPGGTKTRDETAAVLKKWDDKIRREQSGNEFFSDLWKDALKGAVVDAVNDVIKGNDDRDRN